MLRIVLGFGLLFAFWFGVYWACVKTTKKEKMKIGKAILIFSGVTLLAAASAFVLTAF